MQPLQIQTWATEAEPIGISWNSSNKSSTAKPNSRSRTHFTAENGVQGAESHSVTNFLTQASGAKSGFPTIWANCMLSRPKSEIAELPNYQEKSKEEQK